MLCGSRRADQAEELRTRMTTATEEARASLRRMEVIASAVKTPHERNTAWPLHLVLLGLLLVTTLSGLNWQRCGNKSRARESSSPEQRAVDRAAASSERELR
jgi:hypothetical protein